MQRLLIVPLAALLLGLSACTRAHRHPAAELTPRRVSIEVEVYDPHTNFVWVDVGVRVVEAWQEWDGLTYKSPIFDQWRLTDDYGIAYLDSLDLADALVGFDEDSYNRALLLPDTDGDEASVLLEIYAPGLGSVFEWVDLSWDEPQVFVSIPY